MDTNSYSLSDIAALMGNKGFGSDNGLGWLILILLFLGGFNGGFGGRGVAPIPPNVATQTDVQNAVNNQAVNSGLQQVLLSSANNNYETAQLVNGQTNTLMQQNYANQINAIQGFNNLGMSMTGGFNNVSNQIMNQTNQLASKMDQLGFQMEQCCCAIKTTLLQQQLDEANRKLAEEKSKVSSMESANYILGNMGRYVAWEGSGAATQSNVAG